MPSAPNDPVEAQQNAQPQEDRSSIIHVDGRDRKLRREGDEDDDEGAERDRIEVDRQSPPAQVPRAPVDGLRGAVEPSDDEKDDGDQVRDVERAGGQGENGRQGRGGPDVDKGQENDGHTVEPDGSEGHVVFGINLSLLSMGG
jgi:hypothetical protein